MRVIVADNVEAASKQAAQIIIDQVNQKPDSHLGLATGGTVEGIYSTIVEAYRQGKVDFSHVKSVNLDEYRGLTPDNPQSYRYFMNKHLFNHINLPLENTYVASGLGDELEACAAFQQKIAECAPTDLQLLGVGTDGHIAFNEPGEFLIADAHIQALDPETIQSNARFFTSEQEVPRTAITMGMGDILKAKKILLVATGANKAAAMRSLLTNDQIYPQMPVTMLKMHADVTVIIDRTIADALK